MLTGISASMAFNNIVFMSKDSELALDYIKIDAALLKHYLALQFLLLTTFVVLLLIALKRLHYLINSELAGKEDLIFLQRKELDLQSNELANMRICIIKHLKIQTFKLISSQIYVMNSKLP
jgi:hypothetical protein